MKAIRLREGKERSLLRRHPWVFEGSIAKGKADPGETVRVEDAAGKFLAWGAFSPASAIAFSAASACNWSCDMFGITPSSVVSAAPTTAT